MAMQRLTQLGVAAVVFLAVATLCVPALAWTITADRSGINCLRVERTADDTGSATCLFYYRNSAPTAAMLADGTWSNTSNWTFEATLTLDASDLSFEYAPGSTAKYYLARINGDSAFLPLYTAPMPVRLYQQPLAGGSVTAVSASNPAYTSSVNVTVSAMPTVAIGTSMSVDGTLPVAVDSVGSVDRSGLSLLLGAAALLGGAGLAMTTRRGWVA